MKSYSENFKHTLVKKALLTPDKSPRHFAKEAGVSGSALYRWIKEYTATTDAGGAIIKKRGKDWTLEERFNMLLETSVLSEEQQGTYCRGKGIYRHQLTEWKKEFILTYSS